MRRWVFRSGLPTLVVIAVALLVASDALGAAPTQIISSTGTAGQIVVSWSSPYPSSGIYWNTDQTPFPNWAWSDHGTPLACVDTYTHANLTCTGESNLQDGDTSHTITGLAAGTYYVQVATFDAHDPQQNFLHYTNVATVVVPAGKGGSSSGSGAGSTGSATGAITDRATVPFEKVTITGEAGITYDAKGGSRKSRTVSGSIGLAPDDILQSVHGAFTLAVKEGRVVVDQNGLLQATRPDRWWLVSGEAYFNCGLIGHPDACKKYEVVSTTATVTVIGTATFTVVSDHSNPGPDDVRVYAGKVNVAARNGKQEVVTAGKEVTVPKSGPPTPAKKFTPAPHPFWNP
jgi:hypothetical protein